MFERPVAPERFVTLDLVQRALTEDLALGDVTTNTVVPEGARMTGQITAREPLVLCGVEIATQVFTEIDPQVTAEQTASDGDRLAANTVIMRISGRARSLLKAERTALNLLYHLSGIATAAAQLVEAVDGFPVRVCDTRKTTPGLRVFEKYAVACGGARTHRMSVADVVMIKDNHLATVGSIEEAVWRARTGAAHTARVEVECDSLDQVRLAVQAGCDIVLLDNMSPEMAREAVQVVEKRALVEVSGRITKDNAASYAAAGVDVISASLSFARERVDIGLDYQSEPTGAV